MVKAFESSFEKDGKTFPLFKVAHGEWTNKQGEVKQDFKKDWCGGVKKWVSTLTPENIIAVCTFISKHQPSDFITELKAFAETYHNYESQQDYGDL